MTRIGGSCKGCSFAYWESQRKKKLAESDASALAEAHSSPTENSPSESGSEPLDISATEASIFDDPARALADAVRRLTEIGTELAASNLSTVEVATAIPSPVVDEPAQESQVSHGAMCEDQQMLKARVNAIFRCVGLLENHEKVLHNAGQKFWKWHQLLEEALRNSCYFRSLPYYQLLLQLKYKLPGIADLLRFMDVIFSKQTTSLITIYEISGSVDANLVRHEFKMNDQTQLLSHWDILHSPGPYGDAVRSSLLVDGLDSVAVEILGNALKIHPLVFARHLWRNFGRDITDHSWEGPPLSQAPLCSLPDQPAQQIAVDVETYKSHRSLTETDLLGLEDLKCIETIGELHDLRRMNFNRREESKQKARIVDTLGDLQHHCGVSRPYLDLRTDEYTRFERPIARCVALNPGLDYNYTITSTVLSKVELCASATICTVTPANQERTSRTLVLRTPSAWHQGVGRLSEIIGIRNDPFRIASPLFDDAESRGSVYEALRTVGDLEVAGKIHFNQNETSTVVSLSLLEAAMSTMWKMTVSDHQMLFSPGRSFVVKPESFNELDEFSDGCSAYLNDRCQRQRSAMLLLSAVAEAIHLAAKNSASEALSNHVAQRLGRLEVTKAKIESQLQQTEKLLNIRIDKTFRDLQITLAQTQLEESRKAIKQADTVARLTILAFVFIPIGAVCGFFGMNITEIAKDGGFSFWVFGTTMGAVLAMTLLLAFADSIYALWNQFASDLDTFLYINLPISTRWLLTEKVPYVFRWASLKVRAKIASGQNARQEAKTLTKERIERRSEV